MRRGRKVLEGRAGRFDAEGLLARFTEDPGEVA